MMATSMGPNFSGHPAGMGHPGVAGHPMAPGMPHNPGQQGAPAGGMPHQFGGPMAVSAPGGQVNPALMGGMPPGGNPNAHALQHLNPAQQQMFQQQQQQLQQQFNNPQAMAAMRQQQQLLQQQHARQALMAQHAFHANMQNVNGMQMGMQLNQISPQQLQQLRQSGRLGPAQHPQAQVIMAQQLALQQQQAQQAQQQQQQAQQQQVQQQQAAHAQQMQGNPNQGQPMHMTAQNMAAMQQSQLAASLQNQMANQQGQQPQGQPQPQPQPQPQQPGQQPQHTPQPSQAGTPAPTGPQTPAQTPVATPAQPTQMPAGQNQPQGPQTPVQPQPQSQPQPQPQAQPQPQSQPQMAAAHQLALTNSLMQQQQRREGMKGQCLLKLMQFSEHLSGFLGPGIPEDLSYWTNFVMRFFSPNGVFRHSLHITDTDDTTDKQYEVPYPAIARYFHTHFGGSRGGASTLKTMQLIMDKGTTDRPLPGDCHCIENSKASLVYWYECGSHLVATGTLRAQFDAEQKIELFEFLTTGHEEYISRKKVIDAAKPAHMWMKEWHKANSQDGKQSPEMSKKGKGRQMKSPQTTPPEVLVDLPDSAVNSKGVTQGVFQFLEIVEVMGQMNPLFGFSNSNPGLGATAALEQYVATHITGAPQAMNGQPMQPQGPRTPSFGQFPMGASPAAAHMTLPGSPHMGSPAPGHMQAPGMQMQQSQQGQGTGSGGPSANTSPASNKRRRPSGVKTEDDGSGAPTPAGTGQVNGMPRAVKPPTPRMTKRAKGNNAS